jgi:tetratricopeptide (TPR) repeat protein
VWCALHQLNQPVSERQCHGTKPGVRCSVRLVHAGPTSFARSPNALGDYSDAIGINPDFARAFMNRGVAHSAKNNLEDALRDLNKAVELAPRNLEGYYNRAMVFTQLGRLLDATEDYTVAIHLNA